MKTKIRLNEKEYHDVMKKISKTENLQLIIDDFNIERFIWKENNIITKSLYNIGNRYYLEVSDECK
jgi:hypothetical protein